MLYQSLSVFRRDSGRIFSSFQSFCINLLWRFNGKTSPLFLLHEWAHEGGWWSWQEQSVAENDARSTTSTVQLVSVGNPGLQACVRWFLRSILMMSPLHFKITLWSLTSVSAEVSTWVFLNYTKTIAGGSLR